MRKKGAAIVGGFVVAASDHLAVHPTKQIQEHSDAGAWDISVTSRNDEDVRFRFTCRLQFFTFFLQGSLDIMVQCSGDQGQGSVSFIVNNVFYDAFFLKAIGKSCECVEFPCNNDVTVLNGACDNGWCTHPNESGRYHVRICYFYWQFSLK